MSEETPSSQPKATPKPRSPKAPPASAAADKKTSGTASTGEKKAPVAKVATKQVATEPREKPVRRRSPSAKVSAPTKPNPEERYRMVQAAAYFIAEKEGFQGCSVEYWHRAELEIAKKLGEVDG